MQTASMLKPPDRGNSPKKKCSHVTVSLVAIALCLLVGPAQHAEGVPYYRFMDATATAAKGGGKPNIAKPFALDLHPLNIAALNNAPANAAIQPSSHYYYDSNLAGAARVVGGLGAGANNGRVIKDVAFDHPFRLNRFIGRRFFDEIGPDDWRKFGCARPRTRYMWQRQLES